MAEPTPPPADASQQAPWLLAVAEAIDELLWTWDAQTGEVTYANPAFRRFWGLAPRQLGHGRDALLARVHPHDRDNLRQARHALPRTAYDLEYRVLPASSGDGTAAGQKPGRLREQAFPGLGPDRRPLVIHVARDISWQFDTTARLQAEISRRTDAERSLSDANHRLEALIATANDAVVTIDEHSRVVDWNQSAERMFGWQRAEALGQRLTEMIIPTGLVGQHDHGIQRFLAHGVAPMFNRRVETQARRRNGEEFEIELSVWPVKTNGGYTFSSFIRDISRRKQAERALAESEEKYRRVVENVNEGILVTAGGRILYSNPRALELTGLDMETALSHPFIEFIHPDDRELVLGNHLRRLRGEQVENHYQFRVVHRSGAIRWLRISAVVFEWQKATATLNFLTDVTESRQAEEDVRAALARERELSELKSRFVAVASHEFRTPLAAILSSVELLDSYGTRLPEDERAEVIAQIKTAVARMNGMVEQVLLTSRLESGRFAFEPSPRAMPQLLVQLAAEMDRAHPQAHRIAISCKACDEPRMLDGQLVRHVVANLLSNALKYSPDGTPITCTVLGAGDQVIVTVTDQGIGIPGEDLPRLFERFHRGANVGTIAGTGIGLHIVKECVELHQGTIEVTSHPGEGTRFVVRLHAPPSASGWLRN